MVAGGGALDDEVGEVVEGEGGVDDDGLVEAVVGLGGDRAARRDIPGRGCSGDGARLAKRVRKVAWREARSTSQRRYSMRATCCLSLSGMCMFFRRGLRSGRAPRDARSGGWALRVERTAVLRGGGLRGGGGST